MSLEEWCQSERQEAPGDEPVRGFSLTRLTDHQWLGAKNCG
jgi:hypothetical protein